MVSLTIPTLILLRVDVGLGQRWTEWRAANWPGLVILLSLAKLPGRGLV